MLNNLDGKVALVSGSGRGIGREVALKLASEGARVVINDLDAEPANEVVAEIKSAGGQAVACAGNVTAEDFGERFVNAGVEAFGGLDIIVNNAGYTWDNVVQKMSDEQWYGIIDCHLTAPFRILRAAQPVIKKLFNEEKEKGITTNRKVVNISSTTGVNGNAGQINYAAAKAGIIGVTKTLAKEWGRYNVCVNAVAFGMILTRLTEASAQEGNSTINIEGREIKVGINKEMLDTASQMIPLGRPGLAHEGAGAVYLLCSPEASYISGQTIICSGGWSN